MSCPCAKSNGLKASELVDYIDIQAPSDTHEASGAITRTYASAYTRWAKIAPTGGAEGDQFREIEGHATYRIEVQHDATLAGALKDTHRIVHDDGRIFDILRVAPDQATGRITIFANDYAPIITADGLTYSAVTYDVILRNEEVDRPYDEPGERTRRVFTALVRVSDFAPGITAENDTCTISTRTYRVQSVEIPARGDWYRLELADEFGALPAR